MRYALTVNEYMGLKIVGTVNVDGVEEVVEEVDSK